MDRFEFVPASAPAVQTWGVIDRALDKFHPRPDWTKEEIADFVRSLNGSQRAANRIAQRAQTTPTYYPRTVTRAR